jgi:hypothetical protein
MRRPAHGANRCLPGRSRHPAGLVEEQGMTYLADIDPDNPLRLQVNVFRASSYQTAKQRG